MQIYQFAARAEKIYPIPVRHMDGCTEGQRDGKISINYRGLKTRVYHYKYSAYA